MDVTVEVPYGGAGFRVEYQPRPRSGYNQVDMVSLVWQEPQRAHSATLEILGTRDDLRALAARILELIDATLPE